MASGEVRKASKWDNYRDQTRLTEVAALAAVTDVPKVLLSEFWWARRPGQAVNLRFCPPPARSFSAATKFKRQCPCSDAPQVHARPTKFTVHLERLPDRRRAATTPPGTSHPNRPLQIHLFSGRTSPGSTMEVTDHKRGQGQRMRKLQNSFHVTVKYALRGVPADEFEAYFPQDALPPEVIAAAYDAYCQVRLRLCKECVVLGARPDPNCISPTPAPAPPPSLAVPPPGPRVLGHRLRRGLRGAPHRGQAAVAGDHVRGARDSGRRAQRHVSSSLLPFRRRRR